MNVTYLILGAGPTGLGAAARLEELGQRDFLILEREGHVGGLSASFTDGAGFTWDVGGHVVFSHYAEFDHMLEATLGTEVLHHDRVAYVRLAETWVPYPFQNNIRHLPPQLRWQCVEGLLPGRRPEGQPRTFHDWFHAVFGPGISQLFMEPYNFKVWAYPPQLLDYRWIGERVSVIDLERVLRNILLEQDDVGWGPNNRFLFPLRGGTGEIYRRLARGFADRVQLGQTAVAVDPQTRTVRTADGQVYGYTHLLSTLPLDLLARRLLTTFPEALRQAAAALEHNSVHIAGIGLQGHRPDPKCWMYFPEDNCPFYRVTNFHNYSPQNCARPGEQRAIMCETSSSPHKAVDAASLLQATVDGLGRHGFYQGEQPDMVATWHMDVDYGYPVPTLGRDAALAALQPALEALGIASRGRFGGFRYEVGNMDHCYMQGREWAERVVRQTPETVYTIPKV